VARPRKFDEAAVIAASRDLFQARGYAATTLDDLGEVTGLGRGSIYGAFGDKHTVFLRGLDLYAAETLDAIRAVLHDTERSAYERLVAHLREFAANKAADTARLGCFLTKSVGELPDNDGDVVRRSKRFFDTWKRELTTTIVAAQADGDLSAGTDPRRLASLLLTLLQGFDALSLAGSPGKMITDAAEQAIELLPATRARGK
jgi:TetR/AcrR family transcriptional regulator, transcriptional repressor for nem operon